MLGKLLSNKVFLLLCILGCSLYYIFFANRAYVDLVIEVDKTTLFKIYWAEPGQHYSERRMACVLVKPGQQNYHFFLTDLTKVEKLRIDPQQYQGKSVLKKIILRQKGLETLSFVSAADFARLQPLNQIQAAGMKSGGFKVRSSGNDPFFEFPLQGEEKDFDWGVELLRFVFICLLIWLVYLLVSELLPKLDYVPLLLTAALTLVIVMASMSTRNVHPDEYVHLDASNYYQNHWLPPVIEDPEIRHTYSVYGFSRLNTQEMYYLFAGKFQKLLSPLQLSSHLTLRLFNVFLFSLILVYAFKVGGARFLALPLLITPQAWYVFSYCNSDAFALFVTFLVGCQLLLPASMLNTCLLQEKNRKMFGRMLMLGILFGLLFLLKKNYYPYILFLFICFGFQLFQLEKKESRVLFCKRLTVITLIGISFYGLRYGADVYVNGLDRTAKIESLREKLAAPLYKPSTDLHKKHPFLYRKARGVTLETVVKVDRWFEKTFRSGFGVYGYFTISGTYAYYDMVRWLGTTFLVFFLGAIFFRAGPSNSLLTLIAVALSAALIAVSLYHSWTKDFQAQGRYLFPIIPMLSILCYRARAVVQGPVFTFFLLAMFALSAYSFIYVALLHIPRVVFT